MVSFGLSEEACPILQEKLSAVAEKIFAQLIAQHKLHQLDIEPHWSKLVKCGSGGKALNKRASDMQEAIWEIVTTERRYIKVRPCWGLSYALCIFTYIPQN